MSDLFTWIALYSVKYFYLFLIILALAALEVQIEGRYGWTKKLPTWRIKSRLFGFFMGGKELTGYLFYMLLLLFMLFHLPFLGGVGWTWQAEIEIIFLFILFSVFWDFLWFLLNPYYGLAHFKPSYVYWHHQWVLGIPLDYPRGFIISLMVAFLDYPVGLAKWALAAGVFLFCTFVVILINQLQRKRSVYWKKHRYYKKTEKK
jgi:hypothetical protein